jgi:hypothetical protein
MGTELKNQGKEPEKKTTKDKSVSGTTKLSGTSSLVSGNSLTGKNPFAILKASAIASTC